MILVEKGGTGLSRGCAFVNYSTYEAATAAISALDNQVILPGGPYNLRVTEFINLYASRSCMLPIAPVRAFFKLSGMLRAACFASGALCKPAGQRLAAAAVGGAVRDAQRGGPQACVLHTRAAGREEGRHRERLGTLWRGEAPLLTSFILALQRLHAVQKRFRHSALGCGRCPFLAVLSAETTHIGTDCMSVLKMTKPGLTCLVHPTDRGDEPVPRQGVGDDQGVRLCDVQEPGAGAERHERAQRHAHTAGATVSMFST